MKICSFITVRFYLDFQKFSDVHMCSLSNSLLILLLRNKYFIYAFIYVFLYTRSFLKELYEWFNFIIIFVTSEVFIIFFPLEEAFLDINMLSISTSFKKIEFLYWLNSYFSISISPDVIIYLPSFVCDNKFLCFIMVHFFRKILKPILTFLNETLYIELYMWVYRWRVWET